MLKDTLRWVVTGMTSGPGVGKGPASALPLTSTAGQVCHKMEAEAPERALWDRSRELQRAMTQQPHDRETHGKSSVMLGERHAHRAL